MENINESQMDHYITFEMKNRDNYNEEMIKKTEE
jgi:hypothetical protein